MTGHTANFPLNSAPSVTLIGAGPGDPELMTRKGWRLLGQADVVLHDALLDAEGMKEAAPQARWIAVGKRGGKVSVEQAFIGRLLVSYARQGLKVVRLKGGDPSIFGRMSEEIEACQQAGVSVEIVPGVTTASAAAAHLQTSLTLRGVSRSVVFVTPRVGRNERPEDSEWLRASLAANTVVLYMASAMAREIGTRLIQGGKSSQMPVCVLENVSPNGQSLAMTLLDLSLQGLPAMTGPVVLMVGEAFKDAQLPAMHTTTRDDLTGTRDGLNQPEQYDVHEACSVGSSRGARSAHTTYSTYSAFVANLEPVTQ